MIDYLTNDHVEVIDDRLEFPIRVMANASLRSRIGRALLPSSATILVEIEATEASSPGVKRIVDRAPQAGEAMIDPSLAVITFAAVDAVEECSVRIAAVVRGDDLRSLFARGPVAHVVSLNFSSAEQSPQWLVATSDS
jgi:hypothetical protein